MCVAATVSCPAEHVGGDAKRGATHAESIGAMVCAHEVLHGRDSAVEL